MFLCSIKMNPLLAAFENFLLFFRSRFSLPLGIFTTNKQLKQLLFLQATTLQTHHMCSFHFAVMAVIIRKCSSVFDPINNCVKSENCRIGGIQKFSCFFVNRKPFIYYPKHNFTRLKYAYYTSFSRKRICMAWNPLTVFVMGDTQLNSHKSTK